jgi:hypothetical protein
MKYFISFLLLFVIHQSIAQPSFGGKAGLNISTIKNFNMADEEFDASVQSSTGIDAGLFLRVRIAGLLGFRPELAYSQKGAMLKATEESGTPGTFNKYKSDLRFNYIDVPLLFSFRIKDKADIFFGPQLSYMFTYKSTDKIEYYENDVLVRTEEYEEAESRTDIFPVDGSLVIGGEFYIIKHLGIGTRYEKGFAPVFLDDSDESPYATNSLWKFYVVGRF